MPLAGQTLRSRACSPVCFARRGEYVTRDKGRREHLRRCAHGNRGHGFRVSADAFRARRQPAQLHETVRRGRGGGGAVRACGAARGAGPRVVRDRRSEGQAVPGHLDRRRVVHGLHGIVRAGGDSRRGVDRARDDLAQLLRDAVGCRRRVHGAGQRSDHQGVRRELHPRVRGGRARGLGRPGAARGRQAGHGSSDRCGQRRCRCGRARLVRGQRRLDGRASQPGGRARRAGVPEEAGHQHAGPPSST